MQTFVMAGSSSQFFTCERREGFEHPPINLVHAQILHSEHGTSTPLQLKAQRPRDPLGLHDELKKPTISDQPHCMIRSSCCELSKLSKLLKLSKGVYPSPVPSLAIEPLFGSWVLSLDVHSPHQQNELQLKSTWEPEFKIESNQSISFPPSTVSQLPSPLRVLSLDHDSLVS